MSASRNFVIIMGNLGQDPEVRYTPGGDAVANLSVATSERWKDKSGEEQEHTEWHRVVFFGRLAEVAGEFLKKGRPVFIEGKLRTEKYTDKEGVERWTTKVYGDRMQLLPDGKGEAAGQRRDTRQPSHEQVQRDVARGKGGRGGRAPSYDDIK